MRHLQFLKKDNFLIHKGEIKHLNNVKKHNEQSNIKFNSPIEKHLKNLHIDNKKHTKKTIKPLSYKF